jgi:hypothetical protein
MATMSNYPLLIIIILGLIGIMIFLSDNRDIAKARKMGLSYEEYLEKAVSDLDTKIKKEKICGSPEWVRLQWRSFYIAAPTSTIFVYGVFYLLFKKINTAHLFVTIIFLGVIALLHVRKVRKAKAEFENNVFRLCK